MVMMMTVTTIIRNKAATRPNPAESRGARKSGRIVDMNLLGEAKGLTVLSDTERKAQQPSPLRGAGSVAEAALTDITGELSRAGTGRWR